MQLAENTNIKNCVYHKDVTDAMFRQVNNSTVLPFKKHRIDSNNIIHAIDYDLGGNGVAYYDQEAADYHASTGSDWITWNSGNVYRNDGVDIQAEPNLPSADFPYYVTNFQAGEWLQYTVDVVHTGVYTFKISLVAQKDNSEISVVASPGNKKRAVHIPADRNHHSWQNFFIKKVQLVQGKNNIVFYVNSGVLDFKILNLSGKSKYPRYLVSQETLLQSAILNS